MNAVEARSLSIQNQHKVANELVKASIILINGQIKEASSDGKMYTDFRLQSSGLIYEHKVVEQIENYFSEKGFKVESFNRIVSLLIRISW